MSFHRVDKLLKCFGISAFLWLGLPAASWAQTLGTPSCASGSCGQTSCDWLHCPPCYKYCQEGPPRLHFHCACAHPVCNPCDLPHWGFWDTCWNPWPYPPNWTHCVAPPPAALVSLNPYNNRNMPAPLPPRLPGVTPQSMPLPPANLIPPAPGGVDGDLNTPRPFRPGQ